MVDSPLSAEQLASPRIAFSIIRPLEEEYTAMQNPAILYCLMVNRLHFIKTQTHTLSLHSVNATRASLCEILASCIIRRIEDEPHDPLASDPNGQHLLRIANLLARSFSPFQGAPQHLIPPQFQIDTKTPRVGTFRTTANAPSTQGHTSALELSLVSEAKSFIRSSPVQKVVEGIYRGQIVYSATAYLHLLPDKWKRKPITLYNPAEAPLLDHYRLQVPRIRAALETTYFLVLFLSYFLVLETRVIGNPPNGFEWWFIIYALGFTLDKFASTLDHGWQVFASNLWNGLDALFCVTFMIYLGFLAKGELEQHHAVLSCAAVFLLPRLAFVVLSDNMLVLSLRAMLNNFIFMMLFAIWCFSGFLYALWLLGGKEYELSMIAKYMTFIFFGLDGSGIEVAPSFHPVLGPVLVVVYACLSNTLLTTVLVSILTMTFANISQDATAEGLYRRTVVIFQGIKSDGLFNYQPPLNLVALFVLVPIRFVTSPRRFHTINVFCTRLFSGPILLLVAVLERRHIKYFKSWKDSADNEGLWEHTIITHISKRFQRFSARAEVEAVFDSVEDIPIESRSGSPAGKKTGSHRGHKKPAPHTSQHPHSFPHAPRKRRESALAALFKPENAPSSAVWNKLEPDTLAEFRDRLDNIEEANKRIESALQTLIDGGIEQ